MGMERKKLGEGGAPIHSLGDIWSGGLAALLATEKGALAQLEIAETGDGLALVLNDLFD